MLHTLLLLAVRVYVIIYLFTFLLVLVCYFNMPLSRCLFSSPRVVVLESRNCFFILYSYDFKERYRDAERPREGSIRSIYYLLFFYIFYIYLNFVFCINYVLYLITYGKSTYL